MEALAEGWRYELSHFGIDSVIIEPGAFPTTDFGKNMQALSPKTKNPIAIYRPLATVSQGFVSMLEESVKSEQANDPQLVADAISKLIAMPADQRTIRTVVDPFMENALNPLNEMTDKIQISILGWMQLQDLQRVRSTVES
jgi:NAD(P)-dependent dehydrogenase (short-subunit alcohol dehydrogenase family)